MLPFFLILSVFLLPYIANYVPLALDTVINLLESLHYTSGSSMSIDWVFRTLLEVGITGEFLFKYYNQLLEDDSWKDNRARLHLLSVIDNLKDHLQKAQ